MKCRIFFLFCNRCRSFHFPHFEDFDLTQTSVPPSYTVTVAEPHPNLLVGTWSDRPTDRPDQFAHTPLFPPRTAPSISKARPAAAAHRARPLVAGWWRGSRAPASEPAACALEESPVSVEGNGDAPSGPGELQWWEGAVVLCSY